MSEQSSSDDVNELKIKAIIGFDGCTNNGFIIHPDGKHVLYPLGNKVTIQDWSTKKQTFLVGHTNIISSIAVSRSGKYVASGQINHIGFKARVIIWDFEKQTLMSQYEHHKVRVEAVTFSKDDRYVITIGGRDCGSVVVWDIEAEQVLCGSQAARGSQGDASVIQSMTRRGACFITGGEMHLSVWTINQTARNVASVDVAMAKLKRNILCLDTNERDEFCYCGTTTGDVLKIRLYFHHDTDILEPVKQPALIGCWARLSRKKLPRGSVDLYQKGVRSLRLLFNGQLLIGAGDGTIELVEESLTGKVVLDTSVKLPSVPGLKVLKSTNVIGGVTSIQLLENDNILAATDNSEIFLININNFHAELVVTCHTSTIYAVAFPHNFSEVFATAGKNDVRVWCSNTVQELLRIRVQNFHCSSVIFSHDGKSILTGWSDGIIRSFTPLTGRLIYSILNAHNKGVSALTTTSNGNMLISGGCEGQVRLWDISPYRQQLICTLKEHKGPVSSIDINKFNTEAASAAADRTCIIWDLERQCRRQIIFANTLFLCLRYFPSSVQLLTGGSDRKLAYWEVLDGSLVRELEGSPTGTINSLDISPSGERFVSGGNDQIVKVWKYQEGVATHIGLGHAAVVTATRFSANGKFIVTCDASGCVFLWECPEDDNNKHVADDDDGVIKKDVDAKDNSKNNVPKIVSPKLTEAKQEDIRDLPSVRSSRSGGGETRRSTPKSDRNQCNCNDSKKSSPVIVDDDGCRSTRSTTATSKDSFNSTRTVQSNRTKIPVKSGCTDLTKQQQPKSPGSVAASVRSQKSVSSISSKHKGKS